MPSSVAMGADRCEAVGRFATSFARTAQGRARCRWPSIPRWAFVICCQLGTSLRQFGILVIRSQRDGTKRTGASRAIEILYGAPSVRQAR